MPELLDAFGHAADQNIDQVHGPKALPGAIGAGQQLLREYLAVAQRRPRQPVDAIASFWWLKRLAEISEQVGTSAVRGFGQTDKRLQLGTRDALERVRAGGLLDHAPVLHDIREAICHPGAGWLAVAPRAAGLLIIGLDALRPIERSNEAHVP